MGGDCLPPSPSNATRRSQEIRGEKSEKIEGGKWENGKKIVNWQTQMRNQINTQSSVKHSKRQRAKEQEQQQMGHAMSG